MIEIYKKKTIKNYAIQMDAEPEQMAVYNREYNISVAVYFRNWVI